MKKILSFVLCMAMLLMPVLSASAEETTAMLTYTHPTLGYSFEYPAEMVLLCQENLPMLLDAIEQGVLNWDAEMVTAKIESLGDMVVICTQDAQANMLISCTDMEMELTDVDVLISICPSYQDQMMQVYQDCEVLNPGNFYTAGYRMMVSQTFRSESIGSILHYIYDVGGTNVYMFTVNLPHTMPETDQENLMGVMNAILSSMRYPSDMAAE